jgi:BirA family biotin operon repressor/biotin-[acetyl-CoA-carboxylase] ligase
MKPSTRVPNPWEGASVFVKERTRSTMDDVLELAVRGYPVGTAVIAGFQDSGRGRAPGRRWISAPWQSLLFSVVLSKGEPGFPVSQLPLRAAVAVCRSVEGLLEAAVRVKWPNDVIVSGRKLAGILCEGRRGFYTCGVGMNCSQSEFPPELSGSACSLRQAGCVEISVFDLCAVVLRELRRVLSDPGWKADLDTRLEGLGSSVTVRAPGSERTVTGILEGVEEDGALRLRVGDGGFTRVSHGEISGSRRPASP